MKTQFKEKIRQLEEKISTEKDYNKKAQIRDVVDLMRHNERKRIRKEKEIEKKEKIVRSLENPPIKNKKTTWIVSDIKNGILEGFYKEKKIFEIKRGVFIFEMKIVNKNFVKDNFVKPYCSPNVFDLQKKAEKILKD